MQFKQIQEYFWITFSLPDTVINAILKVTKTGRLNYKVRGIEKRGRVIIWPPEKERKEFQVHLKGGAGSTKEGYTSLEGNWRVYTI